MPIQIICSRLLCCPVLSPQMVGTILDTPPTWKVSVQVPAIGWEVVNDTKSKLNWLEEFSVNEWIFL
jgi:hypothetical protein